MRKIIAISFAFLLCGCAAQPAGIIVKSSPYVTLNAPSETLSAPIVRAIPEPTSTATAYKSRTLTPNDVYSGTGRRTQYEQPREDNSQFSSHILRNPMRAIEDYTQGLRSNAFSRRGGRYENKPYEQYDSPKADIQRVYEPHVQGASIQYVPVMVVSVSPSAEQCDYVTPTQKVGYSGTNVPVWQDQRSGMGRQLHPTIQSQGSYVQDVSCRTGGYTVTYVGTHPTLGTQFSGTFTTKRPPKSAYLNLPFSF